MACQGNCHDASPAVRLPPKAHFVAFENGAVPPYQSPDPVTSAQDIGSGSASTSPTLVRSSSSMSTVDQSPVIRSIFPTYNNSLSISQQSQSHNTIEALRCEKLVPHLQRSALLEVDIPYLQTCPAASTMFDPPPRSSLINLPRGRGNKIQRNRVWPSLRRRKVPDIELQEKMWTGAQLNLSHFYPFASEDQRLSQGTRVCLKLLYWCFEAFVWTMGSFVGILAAGIVSVGSCVERR